MARSGHVKKNWSEEASFLPISVIVPLVREEFYRAVTLPYILANKTAQIIEDRGEGNANVKRNRGMKQATQPYLFFCDDDIILQPYCLSMLLAALRTAPQHVVYAYSDYYEINHPTRDDPVIHPGAFDPDRLRSVPCFSTMPLFWADTFPGFDPTIEQLQDYEVQRNLLARGLHGVYVPRNLFVAIYDGNGISQAAGYAAALRIVKEKWEYR